jgi:hypothetical protein
MPMAGPVLGALLDVAANVANPIGAVPSLPGWLLTGTAFVSHMQTAATVLPGSMTVPPAGGSVVGTGKVGGMNASVLGGLLAAASGALSPPAAAATLPIWTSVAAAFIGELTNNAVVTAALFVAPPPVAGVEPGGAMTGTGLVTSLDANRLGTAMNNAAGTAKSPTALSSWIAIATQIVAHITTLGLANAPGLACPSGGGPLTGAGPLT